MWGGVYQKTTLFSVCLDVSHLVYTHPDFGVRTKKGERCILRWKP